MTEQSPELKPQPLTFKEQWEQQRLLKRAKKKARRVLEKQGFSKKETSHSIKNALNRIAANQSNRPEKKAAGRGG